MGGPGSGTWDRWQRRSTLDDALNLDVRRLKREGLLRPGRGFKLRWQFMNDTSACIDMHVESYQVTLRYRYRGANGHWRSVLDPVSLVYTHCTYGGKRVWFECPGCDKRAAKLYSTDHLFRCRGCARMPYRSQCETELSRANRKARRLRENLGGTANPDLPHGPRPKGMHEQTFERLTEDIYEAMGHAEDLFSESCRKFMARYP
jgi:hypothetical protein